MVEIPVLLPVSSRAVPPERGLRDARLARWLGLLGVVAGCSSPSYGQSTWTDQTAPHFEAVSDEAAWDLVHRGEPSLPLWARILFQSLPRTTAIQLDLDALHRARNPLGPVLSARLCWIVADANRCAYAKAIAEADLARAGVDLEAGAGENWQEEVGEAERVALDFARALTLTAAAITDEDVARLIEAHGTDDAVAIVHTVAHANFQDRIFLALGLISEPEGPLPPLEVRPTAETEFATPPRPDLVEPADAGPGGTEARAGWKELSFEHLQDRLELQKLRSARIPDLDEARLARLPRPVRERVAGSAWGRVSMGYQPVLTSAWFETMRAFEAEAQMDDVFASSVFWVVTRSSECFY